MRRPPTFARIVAALTVIALAVTVPALAAQVPITFRLAPDGSIQAGDHDFGEEYRIARSRTGLLAVHEFADTRIVLFSPTGRVIRSIGRAGSGPGEVRIVQRFGWIADTLWLSDVQLRRTTFFAPDGRMLRIVAWPEALHDGQGRQIAGVTFLSPLAYRADRSVLFRVQHAGKRGAVSPFVTGARLSIARADTSGRFLGVVASVSAADGTDCVQSTTSGQSMASVTVPLCPDSFIEAGGDSGVVAVVHQKVTGTSGSVSAVVNDARGRALVRAALTPELVRVPPAVAARLRADLLARAGGQRPAPGAGALRELVRRIQIPTVWPPVDCVVVGDGGRLLLGSPTGEATRRWQLLGPDGTVRPVVLQGAPTAEPRVLHGNELWVAIRSDDDEVTLRRMVADR
jgi:hypothetical protein